MHARRNLREISSLLIGMGLFVSLLVLVNLTQAHPTDPLPEPAFSTADQGFAPYVIPAASSLAAEVTPVPPTPRSAAPINQARTGAHPAAAPPAVSGVSGAHDPTVGTGPLPTAENTLPAPTQPSVVPSNQANATHAPPVSTATRLPPTATASPAEAPTEGVAETGAPYWLADRLVIPAIGLDTRVVPAQLVAITYDGKPYQQWVAPDAFAAGRLTNGATLGELGNTVLIGHHNIYGEVFAHLADLEVGAQLLVYSGAQVFTYTVSLSMILPERDQPIAVRLQNAQWIGPTPDERLTLVTCWPHTSNTHRLIIVAYPNTETQPLP